jgi:hypothetical protein
VNTIRVNIRDVNAHRVAAAIVATAALILTGCSQEETGLDDPYVEVLVDGMVDTAEGELRFTRAQAECVAPRWVATVGVDRLVAEAMSPAEFAADALPTLGLTPADGNQLYNAFSACGVDFADLFVQSLAETNGLSSAAERCVRASLDDAVLRPIMVTLFVEGEAAYEHAGAPDGPVGHELAGCGR